MENEVIQPQAPVMGPQEMMAQTVPTAQVGTASVKYTGFWIRWAANIIDGVIITLISIVIGFILGIVIGAAGSDPQARESASKAVGNVVGLIVTFGYYIIMTYKKEATWGKTAFGVKVIDTQNRPLGLGQVILRELVGKIISMLILGIGFLMAAFTSKKQALHDKIASTYVVYQDPNAKPKTWLAVLVFVVYIVFVAIMFFVIVMASLSAARDKAVKSGNDAQQKATPQVQMQLPE